VSRVVSISSRENPLLVRLRKLVRSPGAYRREGHVFIEGEHLCTAWRTHRGTPAQALVSDAAWAESGLRDLALSAAEVVRVSDALFAGISALGSPNGLGFLIDAPASSALDPVAPSVVLDRLQDAGNVGSVLRSAAAMGFTQVVALEGTAALWAPKVLRAGMGAHFGLRLIDGAAEASLMALAVPLLAASSHAPHSLDEAALPFPCAWVFGHEGQGIGESLLARCAQVLRIPQPGGQESLNVAAAAAVCLYVTRHGEASQ
jgi:TrmH family RNA methyltransferase